jgi:hypothetical protein
MTKDRNRYLYKRGGTYYFQKKVNGRMVKRALATNLTESRRLRDELLLEIAESGTVEKVSAKPETTNDEPLFSKVAKERIAPIPTGTEIFNVGG